MLPSKMCVGLTLAGPPCIHDALRPCLCFTYYFWQIDIYRLVITCILLHHQTVFSSVFCDFVGPSLSEWLNVGDIWLNLTFLNLRAIFVFFWGGGIAHKLKITGQILMQCHMLMCVSRFCDSPWGRVHCSQTEEGDRNVQISTPLGHIWLNTCPFSWSLALADAISLL